MDERNIQLGEGHIAPEFVLKDQNGKDFKRSKLKGKKVLLSFHPLAWTGICAKQMQSLETNSEKFESLNVVPIGISVDAVPTKRAWAEHLEIKKVQLLSDFWPHGNVAKLYEVFRENDGFSERANIILDEKGQIVFLKIYEISQLPDIEEIINIIKQL